MGVSSRGIRLRWEIKTGGGDPTCDMVTRNHRRIHAVHRAMHRGACL